MSPMNEVRNQIEAILFASGKGVSADDIAIYCDIKTKEVNKQMELLREEFDGRDGSLQITHHDDKWKLTVRGKYLPYVEKIVSETELAPAILKTLAVVAYKSPVYQADVVSMRGQSAYEHIKELVKQKFITKEESGRTYTLKITDKFYEYFDVEGDEEIREVFEKLRAQREENEKIQILDDKEQASKKEEQEHLGKLDVIEIEPRRKEYDENTIKEEQNFLTNIDKKIEELSKRVDSQELPTRTNTEKDVDENNNEDKEIKEKDSLQQIEDLAKETKQKNEEDFL